MGIFSNVASAIESKSTSIADYTWAELFPHTNAKSGVSVNVDTSLRVTTVFACCRVLAEGLAQLPVNLFNVDPVTGAKTPTPKNTLTKILSRRPNDWMTSFEMRETMMFHAVLTGNAYAYIGWGGGKVQELIPLVPSRVVVQRNVDYSLTYYVSGLDGGQTTIPAENILHIKGPSWNSYLGMDCVQLAREAIGLAITTEETHASLHANGAQPGGVLSVKGKLDDKSRERLKASWQAFQGGVGNKYKTAVLDIDADWRPMSMTGVDSQHLETRRFQIEEVCRAMRVFPQLVMHTDKTSTFASADAFFLAHVTHSLMPWIRRWEEAIEHTLLDDEDNTICKFNTQALLRGDVTARGDFYMKALGGARGETAYMTRNEVRALEDMNPIEGGDKLLMPPPAPVTDPKPVTDTTSGFGKGTKGYDPSEERDGHGRWGFGSLVGSYAKAAVINTVLGLFGLDILPTWAVAGIVESRKAADITEAQFTKWYAGLSDEDKKRLHDDIVKSLNKEQHAMLVQALAGKKYSPDQPRSANGQFGSGGSNNSHLLRVGATVAVQSIIGALKGSEGGLVGAVAGAAIGAGIAAFVEFGGANFVGEHIIALVGPHVLPDWAHSMLVDHHENHGKAFHNLMFDKLSDEDKVRFCLDTLKRMSPEMLRQLGEKIVADGNKSYSFKYNPDQPRDDHGRFGSGASPLYKESTKTAAQLLEKYGAAAMQKWLEQLKKDTDEDGD